MGPFPGMDPYLEAPDIWPDFQDRLAATTSAMLNATLPFPYYARLQKRPEMGVILEAGVPWRIIPDVVLMRRPGADPRVGQAIPAGGALIDKPRTEVTAGVELRVHTDLLWMDYTPYPVTLREPLPCIPLPLSEQDPDVPLDLQVAAQRTYQEGPYLRAIDYSSEPEPPLDKDDTEWADVLLHAAGLRQPNQRLSD